MVELMRKSMGVKLFYFH